jgi:hypothetical protein
MLQQEVIPMFIQLEARAGTHCGLGGTSMMDSLALRVVSTKSAYFSNISQLPSPVRPT